MGFLDIQVKYRTGQHLAHNLQGNRGIVDQENLYRRRYTAIGREDCCDILAAEWLGQELVGIELARKIDTTLVGSPGDQRDESLVSRNSRRPRRPCHPLSACGRR